MSLAKLHFQHSAGLFIKIIEQFLFCQPLLKPMKDQDIFDVVVNYLNCHNLSWEFLRQYLYRRCPLYVSKCKRICYNGSKTKSWNYFYSLFSPQRSISAKITGTWKNYWLDETVTIGHCMASRSFQPGPCAALRSSAEGLPRSCRCGQKLGGPLVVEIYQDFMN